MWPSVIEILQHDENQREPGTWSIIHCDPDKQKQKMLEDKNNTQKGELL